MSTRDDKNIQFSEYAGKFTEQVNSADKLRTDAMQRLQTIRSARQKNQQRQLKKVAEKFGEQHPRTLRQIARIDNEKQFKSFLAVAVSKAAAEVTIPKDSFVFQGRVLSGDIRGLAGVVVQLQDSKNNIIGKSVKTGKDGTYSLILDIDASFKSKKLSAVVLDKTGTQIHKETLPVLIKANAVELRDVLLVEEDKPNRTRFSNLDGKLQIKKEVVPKEVVVAKKMVKTKVDSATDKVSATKEAIVAKKTVKTKDKSTTKKTSAPKVKTATKKAVKRRVVRKKSSKLTK